MVKKGNDYFNFELNFQIYTSTDLSVGMSLQVPYPHGHTQ